jgi:hypothetical protein
MEVSIEVDQPQTSACLLGKLPLRRQGAAIDRALVRTLAQGLAVVKPQARLEVRFLVNGEVGG